MSTTWVSRTPASAAYLSACSAPRRPAPTTATRISSIASFSALFSAAVSGIAPYCDPGIGGSGERARAFENQCLPGLDADHRGADLAQELDCGRADRGAIEAQVLARLGRLGDDQAASAQRRRATQRRVGALDRL